MPSSERGVRGARLILVMLAVLVVGAMIMRQAAVSAWATTNPLQAAKWWPGHPAAERAAALAGLGRSARVGGAPDAVTRGRLQLVATRAPMAIEPLTVAAVTASSRGDVLRAERLMLLARQRDGRALAPHFFLAETYLRTGRIEPGLAAIANLTRLAPNGATASAPFLARFARDPANWPRIRTMLDAQPPLAQAVLGALAGDAANLPILLALAPPAERQASASWVPRMLQALIESGRVRDARSLWAQLSGIDLARIGYLYDREFIDSRASPPFNWALSASPVGLAERQPGTGLHVIFHGTQSGPLAQQLLTLPPGAYRLEFRMSGSVADPRALSWQLTCLASGSMVSALPLAGQGDQSWRFEVPAGCAAQRLELTGRAQDIGGRSDVVFSAMRLERASG